jgi:hypothetical protein|tara:strand:+ start:156 stop:596 length:441 start_codon:yes stop_codon:yes gene_type:complete
MISIKNFLSKEVCNYCINFFNINESKASFYQKRKKIHILEMLNLDPKIDWLVDKYKEIYPGYYIKNFEILKWPIGEYHDWHDDSAYYNKTTITFLNENYEGGRTTIDNYTAEPETGKIILFNSDVKHKVSPLINGDRYVMLVWYKN